ncbi:hypothetical protein AGABI1DRAFT_66131 [Agaricus bisporus var. burnettii JB137-S8]|uniref:GP-PDE domain-containing protein n=1 Tax=Agaricus bisporus var. burnettii (strain JB137-S8 / ATCC MYA-4627 / FGSC 10392) TaxID=597362 RepID=K5X6H4_AGABU|nr:uncharacterized protein AGABI1DRAFT_66131 [Agaricus bisporus var. burnettii JB137-S8]EKM83481.1 hypothetical protein AGABI1DRAFT_66131 [Agaricus bisporus var. burnettii JB137-S8]
MSLYASLWFAFTQVANISGTPEQSASVKYYDIQGHRGARGDAIENTIPAFARGLLNGVTTLEMDNGLTKDGVVVVWHDWDIKDTKCKDTKPAFPNDPDFPYVGKFVANLTLAQIKTLDCGSLRQDEFPMQLTTRGMKISTMEEVFDFVNCVDTKREVSFNVESKVNPRVGGITRNPADFVAAQHAAFVASGYPLSQIQYQSFDWRTLIEMHKVEPQLFLSALIKSNFLEPDGTKSPWHAGLDVRGFPGATLGEKIAYAAASINATILSPADTDHDSPVLDPTVPGYIPFTTKAMIDRAHELGLKVIPWTVNRLNVAQQLIDWKVDGIITDYGASVRALAKSAGLKVRPRFGANRVRQCVKKHIQLTSESLADVDALLVN